MKRLIVCADGTWNFRDQMDDETKLRHVTNVTKIARAIVPRSSSGIDQVVIYHDGVGTGDVFEHLVGGASGKGIEGNIRDLYRSIAYNYADGDEIFLLGFSRGAYTVRTLAGFMHHFGLLQKEDDFFVPDLFEEYEQQRDLAAAQADPHFRNLHAVRPCPPIKFIGVWDTVGALGAPGPLGGLIDGKRYAYHDIELNPTIQNAFHAVALDERRVPFKPSLWTRPAGWQGHVEQTWFAGVHCNVGGGYSPDGLANESLHWMTEKASEMGLELNVEYLAHFRPCFNSTLNNSMSLLYRPLGEYLRPLAQHRADGEQLHRSVLDRIGLAACNYSPRNVPKDLYEGETALPVVDTTGIARGIPCELVGEPPTPLR
jgi:uncharacterized protein (DUF2235 family)